MHRIRMLHQSNLVSGILNNIENLTTIPTSGKSGKKYRTNFTGSMRQRTCPDWRGSTGNWDIIAEGYRARRWLQKRLCKGRGNWKGTVSYTERKMNLPSAYEQEMKELLGTELEAYKKSLDLPVHAGTPLSIQQRSTCEEFEAVTTFLHGESALDTQWIFF